MAESSYVKSADGTVIGYETYKGAGNDPGVVVVGGSMLSGRYYRDLATRLADPLTVHVVDRRGRGASGPQGRDYDIGKECDDVVAVMERTGARNLFGHSYGGLVVLRTALRHPVDAAAVFEPAVSIDGSFPTWFVPGFKQAVAADRPARAMALLVKGLGLSGPLGRLPLPVLTWLGGLMVVTGMGREFREIMPTMPPEVDAGLGLDSTGEEYAGVTARVLLLAGDRTAGYLRGAAERLATLIPHSQITVMPGLSHEGPQRAPERVAAELRAFFRPHPPSA
ncbi:alpha/beta hydrolase [Streptosporangium sp. NPDC051022]|uniref:alpha/beta fold hydrolase n=1 Tax=Streptosporangium sp. NPDC051022 TaxID=3155752 RepID=UPI00344A3D4B